MLNQTNKRFKNSTIIIEGNTIRWENYTVTSANISQIWQGDCPNLQFPVHFSLLLFFIALSGTGLVGIAVKLLALILYLGVWGHRYWKQKDEKGISIETGSGKTYSFLSDNEEFTGQVYDLINDLLTKNSMNSNVQISFRGDGKIVDNSITEKEKEDDKQPLNIMSNGTNEPIVRELEKLYMNYNKKNETDKEILDLIEKAIHMLDINDKEEIKKSFSKFIRMGLINDCNELGLNALIDIIKTNVY
ncbi:hypothetical protein AALB39_16050 [Lachnospiraceae bacterium 54-53]